MPYTHRNLNTTPRVIHETFLVSELSDGLTLALSSEKGTLAQVELAHIATRRRFGRRVLVLDVIDKTEFAELQGKPQAVEHLKIPLGHVAILGRDKLNLPLFQSQLTISENHLELGYQRTAAGDALTIHDNHSTNGSHLVDHEEANRSWQNSLHEVSRDETYDRHFDTAIPADAYDWVFDPDQDRNPRTP